MKYNFKLFKQNNWKARILYYIKLSFEKQTKDSFGKNEEIFPQRRRELSLDKRNEIKKKKNK